MTMSLFDWPPMPSSFLTLAEDAAREAGFPGFAPDACLVNRYEPGAKLSLHQDRNERDYSAPIASVSLGIPAVFLSGGMKRSDPTSRVRVTHGDVVAWGGPSGSALTTCCRWKRRATGSWVGIGST